MENQQAKNSGHHLKVIWRYVCSQIASPSLADGKVQKGSCEPEVLFIVSRPH